MTGESSTALCTNSDDDMDIYSRDWTSYGSRGRGLEFCLEKLLNIAKTYVRK